MYYNFVSYTSKQLENKTKFYKLFKEKNRAFLDTHLCGADQCVDTHSVKHVCPMVHLQPRASLSSVKCFWTTQENMCTNRRSVLRAFQNGCCENEWSHYECDQKKFSVDMKS